MATNEQARGQRGTDALSLANGVTAAAGLVRILPLLVFLGLGVFVVVFRDLSVHRILLHSPENLLPLDMNGLPVSLRVGSVLIERAFQGIFGVFAHLVMGDPASYPLFPGSPWGNNDRGSELNGFTVPLMARACTQLLLLSPVYWAALTFFRTTGVRLLYLIAVTSTVGGGAPLVINTFFTMVQPVINWPHSYYMWDVRTNSHDFAAVGMVHLLALTLRASSRIGAGQAALLAAFGQLFFENLGLATGLCLAAAALILPPDGKVRWRVALTRLVSAGLGSSTALAALMGIAYLNTERVLSGRLNSLGDYAGHYWKEVGQHNFAWLNVSLANLATILLFPCFAGVICGLLAALLEPQTDPERRKRDALITLIPMAAVLVTVLLGLVNSTWEPARQALPAAAMMLLLSTSLIRWLISTCRFGRNNSTNRPL
ncbi:hypothetical protein CCC_02159 [Paramagnetospirillum magnetotacticum MS-1]|uniref:Uncharacterized protein n=1 Tax=Paramagnetospirillum magnetotacticum MS-1 TaxID=272627 RepID=A0A0C2YG49_PARME|nr:hypothetical protein [Paramagnetospirillum magnetotacticum]KIL98709.1 hypothetical protein CCC_02159 [Paramagnetospirillum magnetotacticum MS-1]